MNPLRIALYTHSTNPRGGVVHTLELGDALARAGHDVTIHAPDPSGQGFFRTTAARHVSIPAAPAPAALPSMMVQRLAEISGHIKNATQTYDIHHAQDTISANALADCVQSGRIENFIRTVHHVDTFEDTRLSAWQTRGILAARKCFCVSAVWREFLAGTYDVAADIVANGVSPERFSPTPTPRDKTVREKLKLGSGPIFLTVGGIEARKNTLKILQAFELCRQTHRQAQLIIAGGASLLNHGIYQAEFHAQLENFGIADQIIITGPLPDDDMPSLYRSADALVFPSLKEGFGLVVLEAIACETPVVVSGIAPFTEYLTAADCSFADPQCPRSIAAAMMRALGPQARADTIRARCKIVPAMSWEASAARHLSRYATLHEREFHYA